MSSTRVSRWGAVVVASLSWASPAFAIQDPGLIVPDDDLPPAGAAYHGGTHVFLDGQAALTCSSHGDFTSAAEPPRRPGTTAIASYVATFVGELSLEPPLVSSPVVVPIEEQVQMVERITFVQRRGTTRTLETELVSFDLAGSGLPTGVVVRESPSLGSFGRATITTLPRGLHRVEGSYDVWLEISLDGGQSWHPAEAAVRMSLAPGGDPPRGVTAGLHD